MLTLTNENYHSLEANQEYMSCSQYKGFVYECEAKEIAKLSGAWMDLPSTALEVGQYVHSWSAGKMLAFIEEHPTMFKANHALKAEYVVANTMIECIQADPFTLDYLTGEKEKIVTAEMYGAMWKTMPNVVNSSKGRLVDLATTNSITDRMWNDEARKYVSFVEYQRSALKMAIYLEVQRLSENNPVGRYYEFLMVAVSKQKQPDKAVISLNDPARLSSELLGISSHMPRILELKARTELPIRCEKCNYCRSTKLLSGVIQYSEL